MLVVLLGIVLSFASAFDQPIYMLHYTGLDTIPVAYGSCMPLQLYGHYPASIIVVGADSHCTAFSDDECHTSLSSSSLVKAGLTSLTELGDAFTMKHFMVCTLDGAT